MLFLVYSDLIQNLEKYLFCLHKNLVFELFLEDNKSRGGHLQIVEKGGENDLIKGEALGWVKILMM